MLKYLNNKCLTNFFEYLKVEPEPPIWSGSSSSQISAAPVYQNLDKDNKKNLVHIYRCDLNIQVPGLILLLTGELSGDESRLWTQFHCWPRIKLSCTTHG